MSAPSTDSCDEVSIFNQLIGITRAAAAAPYAEFTLIDEPAMRWFDGDFDSWLQPGETFSVIAPLLIGDRLAESSAEHALDGLADWVRSFAILPITGASAESGYILLASDEPNADASWLDLLLSSAAIIEERLDRTVEQRRIDQMAARLRTNQTELRAAHTRLEVANKELEQFAYIAAHELVAPMRAVAIYAEVLEDLAQEATDDVSQTAQACARSIRDGVSLMTQQVQYLLELSQGHADPAAVEAIDLHDVVSNALDTLAPTLNEADAVVNVGDLAVIHGKAVPLQSVFANLFSNAVRYRDPERDLVLDVRSEAEGNDIVITVTDTGSGVDEADSHRIFQLFERASVDPAGAGIGLALSRRIVESFGGEMGVRSAEPVGASFWMRFPRLTP